MDRENHRVATLRIVENGLNGCVGNYATVPIEFAIDPDCGECGGQCA